MGIYQLPHSFCDELQEMMNSFWWGGGKRDSKGIDWISCDKQCGRMEKRGTGFCNLHAFNIAMLGKQAWRLVSEQGTLPSRIFISKYYPKRVFYGCQVIRA